jgi:hypothetical protein
MELHEDDPDHFEFVLKFIYSEQYGSTAVKTTADKGVDTLRSVVGVYRVADKYDVVKLLGPSVEHFQQVMSSIQDETMLVSAVEAFYDFCPVPGHPAGKALASTIIRSRRPFVKTDKFAALLEKFPVFASDIALHYHKEKLFNIRSFKCPSGHQNLILDGASSAQTLCVFHCHFCNSGTLYVGVDCWV